MYLKMGAFVLLWYNFVFSARWLDALRFTKASSQPGGLATSDLQRYCKFFSWERSAICNENIAKNKKKHK